MAAVPKWGCNAGTSKMTCVPPLTIDTAEGDDFAGTRPCGPGRGTASEPIEFLQLASVGAVESPKESTSPPFPKNFARAVRIETVASEDSSRSATKLSARSASKSAQVELSRDVAALPSP